MLLTCPSCDAKLKLAAPAPAGKAFKCPKCQTIFSASPQADTEDAPKPAPARKSAKPAAVAQRKKAEDVDEDDETDDEDLPASKKARKKKKSKSMSPMTLVMGGVLTVVVLVGSVGLGWMVKQHMQGSTTTSSTSSVSTPSTPAEKPAPKPAPGPPVPAKVAAQLPSGQPSIKQVPTAFAAVNKAEWLQDIEKAKTQAAQEKKDLMLVFSGSDWCPPCIQFDREVISQPAFQQQMMQQYVPVNLDFPRNPPAIAKVQDSARNTKIQQLYEIDSYPSIVLADAKGRPYSVDSSGYRPGGVPSYLAQLQQFHQLGRQHEQVFSKYDQAGEQDKLETAKQALNFVLGHKLIRYYGSSLEDWLKLAKEKDPKNDKGYSEVFFEADFFSRYVQAKGSLVDQMACVNSLDRWKKDNEFKDQNMAVNLHLLAYSVVRKSGNSDNANRYLREALRYKPTDEKLKTQLAKIKKIKPSSGTGFVIANGGYIMTNNHVISGEGEITVRLPKVKDPVLAKVIATDEKRDIALIQIQVPQGVTLKPLILSGQRKVNRGEEVAALGYPLGESVGAGIKITRGLISASPEAGNDNMFLLDVKVNPGNSGGPLCDSSGKVIAMVSAKTLSDDKVDSYGLAVPANDLETFMVDSLKGFKPTPPPKMSAKLSWAEVDQQVSNSVLIIFQNPFKLEAKTN